MSGIATKALAPGLLVEFFYPQRENAVTDRALAPAEPLNSASRPAMANKTIFTPVCRSSRASATRPSRGEREMKA
jgi:hypothetical protein